MPRYKESKLYLSIGIGACYFTFIFVFVFLLSEVDRLDGVNILLVEQAQQTKVILLLELVSFPWLDSIELRFTIHLRALLARQ